MIDSDEVLIRRGTFWVQQGHICDCCAQYHPRTSADAVHVTKGSDDKWGLLCNECLECNREEAGKLNPPVTLTVYYSLPDDFYGKNGGAQ